MNILNIGSLNIDHVYSVPHFVRPGETLDSSCYRTFPGGKGLNQSIALARAGATVRHAGRIGSDGLMLRQCLETNQVDCSRVETCEQPTGHAVIQVTPAGENAIVLHGGANRSVDKDFISRALSTCSPGDGLLLQNETSGIADAIQLGSEARLKVVFNPAPMTDDVQTHPLELVNLFILNETEAEELTGETEPEKICVAITNRFPQSAAVLTLGSRGAIYFDKDILLRQQAHPVKAIDTTAAGDTFIGYFLVEWLRNGNASAALELGCRAGALCVTRAGAAESIPCRSELKTTD